MLRHLAVGVRITCMSGCLVGLLFLGRAVFGSADPAITVFDAVCVDCIVMLVSLLYYCVCKFIFSACRVKVGGGRKVMLLARAPDGSYINFEQRPTEVVWGVPRLTLENVWILVYGVGIVLFVSGYCLLGQHAVSLACFGFAVGVLCVDELVCPRVIHSRFYACVRGVVLLVSFVSLFLVAVEGVGNMLVHFIETLDFYALGFGFCLPFACQFLLVAVRENRHYSLGSVFEIVEFGLPFAVFLSIFHLCVAYGQQFQTGTRDQASAGQTSMLILRMFSAAPTASLVYAVGPFLLWPLIMGYFTCALEGCVIDVLISVNVALYLRCVVYGELSVLVLYGSICCLVSVIGRVACEYDPALVARQWNDRQVPGERGGVDDGQEVVWQREPQEVP